MRRLPEVVASPETTAFLGLPGIDVHGYMKWQLDKHGMRVGGGFGDWAGTAFSIGHMSRAMDPAVIDRYLALTARSLEGRR